MSQMFIFMGVTYALAIAMVTEFYKKTVRKDKAHAWECWLIAGILSVIGGIVLAHTYAVGMEFILIVVLFAVQYLIDMEFVKRIFKALAEKVAR